MKIILASASPRRRELLEQIHIPFEVLVSDVEEQITTTVPRLLVQELSRQKAQVVFSTLLKNQGAEAGDVLVIGADTVVACDGQILGKPKSEAQAEEMLSLLQGRTHQVYTGVTLLYREKSHSFYEETAVSFYPMSREEIAAYVNTKDPMDKAGAYGIQGLCARYISGIEGDYNNVVGLPVGRLYQELKTILPEDVFRERK